MRTGRMSIFCCWFKYDCFLLLPLKTALGFAFEGDGWGVGQEACLSTRVDGGSFADFSGVGRCGVRARMLEVLSVRVCVCVYFEPEGVVG